MVDLTIAIPIGPGHEIVFQNARESVVSQTIPVVGVSYADLDGKGAGWTRNRLLELVETPYVAFLDADDWLELNFVEIMLNAIKAAPMNYVYSGWVSEYRDRSVVELPDEECYCFSGTMKVHPITAIIPTEWLRAIGGFDESLPGMEDTEMFLRLTQAGHCGKAVKQPLLHWTSGGNRSTSFQNNPQRFAIQEAMRARFSGGYMPCCQGQGVAHEGPFGERRPGDIQARVMGASLHIYVGRQSDRIYQDVGYGQLVWADPRDVDSDPVRFQRVSANTTPSLHTAEEVAFFLQQRTTITEVPPSDDVPIRSSIADLQKRAGF